MSLGLRYMDGYSNMKIDMSLGLGLGFGLGMDLNLKR